MKHIKEYNLFEAKVDTKVFSEELIKRFPKLPGSIRKELKYFLNRGWEGRFDVIDTPEGNTHLSLEFPNMDLPEFIFNAFSIPKSAKNLFDLEPAERSLLSALNKDAENLNDIAKKINSKLPEGTKPLPTRKSGVEILENIKRGRPWLDVYKNWPDLPESKWTPGCYLYLYEILESLKSMMFSRNKMEREEVSHDQIKKLPEYIRAINFGFEDKTTPRILANGNLKLAHPSMAFDSYVWSKGSREQGTDAFTIYSSGPIRVTTTGNPTVISSAPGYAIKNRRDWGNKILWVLEYMKRKLAKDEFGISSRNEQERIAQLPEGEYYQHLLEKDPEKLFQYVDEVKPEVRKAILSEISIKDLVEKDPEKAVFILKKHYKLPEIKSQIDSLDKEVKDEFGKNLELAGNLGELGF
jgi:hypothetical protein